MNYTELELATERLILAAQRRENHMGDPIALMSAKAELREAAKLVEACLKEQCDGA